MRCLTLERIRILLQPRRNNDMALTIVAIGIGLLCGCVVLLTIGCILYTHGRKSGDAVIVTHGKSLLSVTAIIIRVGIVVLILGLVLSFFQNR